MSDLTQIVILGASGDLASRKLAPGVFNASCQHLFPHPIQLVGVARRDWTTDYFRNHLTERLPKGQACGFDVWQDFLNDVHYVRTHLDAPEDYEGLGQQLDGLIAQAREVGDNPTVHRVYYLSIKPDLFLPAVKGLHAAGLLDQTEGKRRVVVEKPFGVDLESAQVLNGELLQILTEDQLYRIDHYLGKETVQNILAFRFRNAFFEPLWNQKYVELVQITVAENLGMEGGRGGYYDTSGAVRDILQNHVLQLLALVAMEPPGSMESEAIRNEKVKVLQSMRPPEDMVTAEKEHIIRGQFEGYREEAGVDPNSQTETYIAARTYIDNWRWGGVPFLLRTGKHLPERFTSIHVQFKMPPHSLFGSWAECHMRPNAITLRIQPREGIDLHFEVKEPGSGQNMRPTKMTFDYDNLFGRRPEAYQRLLQDVVNGDQSLFIRSDEVEASWAWADSLRRVMVRSIMHEYKPSSWGPNDSESLFGECEGRWARE